MHLLAFYGQSRLDPMVAASGSRGLPVSVLPLYGLFHCQIIVQVTAGEEVAGAREWFQNGSVNITLKSVPETVYRVIKREAGKQGRSLNAQIIRVLEAEATEVERRRRLGKVRKELERFAASLPALDESAPLIRGDRQR